MTGSPISATLFPTLNIGHSIEFISIDVIIVAKCASMLEVTRFRGEQLDLNEIFLRGGVCFFIYHDAQDSPNHHEGEN